jgi:autotransporter-associated beta strand protein
VLTIREVMTNNDGSTATFNFNGGTLKATGATANFVNLGGASQKAYVKAGGAIINSNGFDVTIPEALLTDAVSTGGGLTKQGTGTLTLSNANTYSGATTVNSGTLAVGASGSISSSTLVDIKDGAEFNTTAQSFTMLAAQTFKFTLNPAGSGSTGLINAASLDITAGVVDFATLGSLDDSAYVIASYTSKTGSAFATVNNLPSGYTIDYGYNSGSQIALVVPEPGTFAMLLGGIGMLSLFRRRRA